MQIDSTINNIADKVLSGERIGFEDANKLVQGDALDDLLYCANAIRKHYKGCKVHFCSIINAKSGRCPENCRFCAQSAHYHTAAKTYPLVETEKMLAGAESAESLGADCYCIVTSGRGAAQGDNLERICQAVQGIRRETDIPPAASLGELDEATVIKLKQAGLARYHHNLETSARFFPKVCSTHTYEDRLKTIRLIKQLGLELCCGGIFGLGEDWSDRLDMAFAIRELGADSVPLNFLMPIPGTPLGDNPPLSAREILKIIALFRFILPDKDIKVCGGREAHLRDMQSWMYYAGANGALIGNYLTTPGRPPEEDLRVIADLGLEV